MPEFCQDMTDVSLLRRCILGAYLRVEYVNDLDTPIHERTCARRSKLRHLRKAYVPHKFTPHKAGVSHFKVWKSETAVVFYVIYVSRT